MRKLNFAIIFILFSTLFLIVPINSTYAQDSYYEMIDIHVKLNEDGSADIVEQWRAHLYEGTENYMIKEGLGKSEVKNFTVKENGQVYDFLEKWDVNASREEKAFKNGIVQTKKGIELNWGIGEYGTHDYTLEYTVTDIIKQLKDSQALYWYFSNPGVGIPRSNIRVEIEAYKDLTEEEENIWSFGHLGDIEFVGGKVLAKSDSRLLTDDYFVVLMKFEDGTFQTNNYENKKFKAIQKEAFKGSDYDSGFLSFIKSIFKTLFSFLIFAGVLVAIVFLGKHSNKNQLTQVQPRTFRRQYKEEYYRDYPYEGNYLHAYYITHLMGLSNFNTLLTSFLLKWIHEDKIRMIESTGGMLRRTSQTIHFLTDDVDEKSLEGRLFRSIRNRANKEHMLTDRDLARWAERNYNHLKTWENNLITASTSMLQKEGYLEKIEKKVLFFKKTHFQLTESGNKVEENIYKYVNYLHDFSLLHEHEAVNVKLWDEIMIWAAYLNLTSVVTKQFAKIYPNYLQESKFKEDTLRRTRHMADTVEKSRRKKERQEQRRRSSGGGGSASRRGGTGASGGGHGGGIR